MSIRNRVGNWRRTGAPTCEVKRSTSITIRIWLGLMVPLLLFPRSYAQGASTTTAAELSGTSWRLVMFLGGDGSKFTPDDKSKYIIAFDASGRVSVRIDCNRGRGTWKSAGANQLEFGPLALTRAMCPQAPLNDQIPKHWEYVRSYIVKEGHLFLSLMADGGTYEFEPMAQAGLSSLPATFIGNLPCADCPGILYQVNLMADHTFSSRMTYQERPSHLDDHGQWQLSDDGKTLTLQGKHEANNRFALHDSNTLRKLGSNGDEIASKLNYDLKRNPTVLPIASRYAETDGVPLEDTYWKLTRLAGIEINAPSGKQEPHLVLTPKTHRITGTGGCNQMSGSYQIDGDRITFTQMISTMMACVEGMDTEKALHTALNDVRTWRVTGQHLELFDASGKQRATFESRPH